MHAENQPNGRATGRNDETSDPRRFQGGVEPHKTHRMGSRHLSPAIQRRPAFGIVLKECRKVRGLSQLDLSVEAGVSSRHVSFIESGRARPSEAMVERLGDAMALPNSVINALLDSAGYAQRLPEAPLNPAPLPNDLGGLAFETAVRIEGAADAGAVIASARHALEAIGLPRFFFATIRPGRSNLHDVRIDHGGSFPDPWLKRYVNRHYASVDPLLTAADECRGGFFWADVLRKDKLCRTAEKLFSDASRQGLDSGFVNSVRRGDGTVSLVSMMGSGLDHRDPRLRVALRTLGSGMLDRMTRLSYT